MRSFLVELAIGVGVLGAGAVLNAPRVVRAGEWAGYRGAQSTQQCDCKKPTVTNWPCAFISGCTGTHSKCASVTGQNDGKCTPITTGGGFSGIGPNGTPCRRHEQCG
jgi:hypothetical protein